MELLIAILALLALDVMANALGPDSREVEAALASERIPVRRDALRAVRYDDGVWLRR